MDKRQFIKTAASSLLALGIIGAMPASQAAGMGGYGKMFRSGQGRPE